MDQGSVLVVRWNGNRPHNQKLIRDSYYKGSYLRSLVNYILYYPITKVKNYLVAWALFNIKSTASNSSKDILEKPESLLRLQIIKFKIVRPRIISSIFCLRFSPQVFLAKTFIIFLTFCIPRVYRMNVAELWQLEK